jgi:predicted ArsR family transcriptional regulator
MKDINLQNNDAPFAYNGLERIFHERGRLAVCTCLIANADGMRFTDLQDACALTDGNLNRHLHALAEVGIIELERVHGNGRPTTTVRITRDGRKRFLAYIDELEAVVRAVQDRAKDGAPSPRRLATQS